MRQWQSTKKRFWNSPGSWMQKKQHSAADRKAQTARDALAGMGILGKQACRREKTAARMQQREAECCITGILVQAVQPDMDCGRIKIPLWEQAASYRIQLMRKTDSMEIPEYSQEQELGSLINPEHSWEQEPGSLELPERSRKHPEWEPDRQTAPEQA